MQRGKLGVAAVAVALVLVASACGRGADTTDDGGDAGGSGADQAKELASVPGFDLASGTIKVGVLTPLTGPVSGIIGIPLTAGNEVFFQALNAKGGIGGKYKVEVVKEDTVYDNPTTIQKYEKIKNDIVMFAQILGTPPTSAVLPKLVADKIVASPASLDAAWTKEINLLPFGAPYQIQFLNAANYYVTEGGGEGKNICMMAIEGPYGDAGVEGLAAAAEAEDFTVKATARFKSTDTDFTAQITQLKDAKCDAVFLTALPANTGVIVGAGAQLGFTPQWFGQSPTWITGLATSAAAPVLEKNFLLVAEGPEWGDETVPGMKQMLADIATFKPDQAPDIYFVFGYVQAQVVVKLLEVAIENGDLSRAGLLAAQEELGKVSVGGLAGDFTYGKPGDRNPSRANTIFKINAAKPGALEAVKKNFVATSAKNFKFA